MRIDLSLTVDVEFDLDIKGIVLVDLMRVSAFAHGCYINIISPASINLLTQPLNSSSGLNKIINRGPAEIAFGRFESKVSYFPVP